LLVTGILLNGAVNRLGERKEAEEREAGQGHADGGQHGLRVFADLTTAGGSRRPA